MSDEVNDEKELERILEWQTRNTELQGEVIAKMHERGLSSIDIKSWCLDANATEEKPLEIDGFDGIWYTDGLESLYYEQGDYMVFVDEAELLAGERPI